MSYYTGTAASLTALRTALLTHAQSDGWVLTGDVLSKAGVYFQVQETATSISCLGCESNAVANPAPSVVSIGRIYAVSGQTTREVAFPCNYEVFGFAQELYLIVNYDVSIYQWMAFGKSTVPGIPGQGGWCGATGGPLPAREVVSTVARVFQITSLAGGVPSGDGVNCGALFWQTTSSSLVSSARNAWVNSGLDAQGWLFGATDAVNPVGIRHATVLLDTQPSVWNSEATLLPIRCYKERASFKTSLIADLQNARLVRIDNLAPGDILTLGADKWKIFPWYKKDAVNRAGSVTGFYDHTGTFGWAIRYEGP